MASPAQLLEALRSGGRKICNTYPYAWRIGAELRELEPDWWHQFKSECPELAQAPLRQAADFEFLVYLEERAEQEPRLAQDLLGLIEEYFLTAEPYELAELANTVEWYLRPVAEAAQALEQENEAGGQPAAQGASAAGASSG